MKAALLALVLLAGGGSAHVVVHGQLYLDDRTRTPLTVVESGATVRWLVVDGFHTVTHSGTGAREFRSPILDPLLRPAFEHTFEREGRYLYFCEVHEHMRAAVLVTSADG